MEPKIDPLEWLTLENLHLRASVAKLHFDAYIDTLCKKYDLDRATQRLDMQSRRVVTITPLGGGDAQDY